MTESTRSQPSPSAPAPSGAATLSRRLARRTDLAPWIVQGFLSGLLGAFVVAVVFLVVDTLEGRPLWTPAALGSALFRGGPLGPDAPWPVLVVGYTGVHGTIFVAIGLLAAFALNYLDPGERSPAAVLIGAVAVLFAAYEVAFLTFAALFVPDWARELGAGWIALANLLAALGMAGWLVRMRRADGPPDRL